MATFRDRYLSAREQHPLRILDIGSQDVNGSYRDLFSAPAWHYTGLDMAAGKNVDIVLRTPYAWREVASASADVVISGQAFEHIEYFWITMLEIARVLKVGGICCILAPSSGPEHRYPVDCWRFYPDGLVAIAKFARLHTLEAVTQWDAAGDPESDLWHDSMLVCRKPDLGTWANARLSLARWLTHRACLMAVK
jgi:SAM-dependent methyltransferase